MLGHLLPITSLPITYEQLNNLVPIKFCTAITFTVKIRYGVGVSIVFQIDEAVRFFEKIKIR